ncbi:HVA22-like protein c [Solanum dulcamara]|uniref:HVA22-like protein c n=1 Tax=Solanum dulcamara TaxID=45834 RepID=UPI002486407E|nr:HVA22-like protein c [Solanum dulcamara]
MDLAWPILALGYPLFVTIRAIETGCVYDKRKVVIYWIIFSFVYLFEHVFAKFLVWVPLWSYLRLIFICWLVIPQLNGAFYLYQNFLHPLKLSLAITQFFATCSKWFKKLKEESFLSVAMSHLEEKGSESQEKLIASKPECNEGGQILGEIQVMECTAKCNAAASNQVGTIDENLLQTENKTRAATQVISKPAIPAIAKLPDTFSPQTVFQTRWTCEICKVTVSSELTLKSHLRGKKHRAEAKLWCTFCNLRVSGEIDMIAHLKGKRHLAKLLETFANAGAT